MTHPFNLSGKVALVTGANTGIGQAIALALAEAGCDVALAGRSRAEETLAGVRQLGRKGTIIEADLSSTAPVSGVFPHDYRFEVGELFVGDTPGHGVDIDEKLAAKYPYKPAYLPVARLEDGTMWNW